MFIFRENIYYESYKNMLVGRIQQHNKIENLYFYLIRLIKLLTKAIIQYSNYKNNNLFQNKFQIIIYLIIYFKGDDLTDFNDVETCCSRSTSWTTFPYTYYGRSFLVSEIFAKVSASKTICLILIID